MKALVFLLFPYLLFGVDQTLDVNIKSSAQIGFTNVAITNSDFGALNTGLIEAVIESSWKYSNSEKNSGQDYKITGQITSHTSRSAPDGWTIQSILESPNSGIAIGKPANQGNYITLPWSDETPVNFILDLPQAASGVGEQLLKVIIDSTKNFNSSQDFVIAWTILPE